MTGTQITSVPAIQLVDSDIIHTRHGTPAHSLSRRGLSLWIDLGRLSEADKQAWLFSVNKFNLVSFHEADFGCNHKSKRQKGAPVTPLKDYIISEISAHYPEAKVKDIHILAFPRILGMAFNPISVYRCTTENGAGDIVLYEVHNTFGDSHTYFAISKTGHNACQHDVAKSLHVSPFYNMDGEYRLGLKLKDRTLRLLVRYSHEMKTRLTATLDGTFHPLSSGRLLSFLCRYLHLPMRVWTAIHVEAVKLFLKRCRFHRRPEPETTPVTIAQPRLTRQKG